ncbi:MAG: CPBP family intramembrane glutamic endopeptidase [Verrucomicrobiota bacterium]|nr:CPBP family intramembrane glutamic endopeptidase [Verrucomicrobiota bacterium]
MVQKEYKFFLKKKEIFNVFIYCILFVPIIFSISIVSKLLLPEFSEQQQVKDLKDSFLEVISRDGIIIILLAPIIEEVVFRGLFYAALKSYFPWFMSLMFSSFIFSIIHENILAFTLLFSLSLLLTIIYELYGRLFYPILIHSCFNISMLLLIYFGK